MKIQRNIDGVYFRVERDGKWENICFSDLTEEEMDNVLENKDSKWILSLIEILLRQIKILINHHEYKDDVKKLIVTEVAKFLGNWMYKLGEQYNVKFED